ncbi:MAG: CRISPR-associated endonuclease Cas1 [Desulfarculus sp.]|nr:CRISPR-associated endonuclease Cas1 [Desulfarculus sp.]
MPTLFEQISGQEALRIAWEKVRANQGASGGDGQTIASFEVNLAANLLRLGQSLISGTYRPGPLRRVAIPKKSGGTRTLAIPPVRDRIIQTAVATALTPILDPQMEDCSFAYRPGRSVAMAVRRVSRYYQEGYRWVVDGDIDDYFDSVPHQPLLEIIGRYVPDAKVIALIALWLRRHAPQGRGLPQGSPLSPILSNIFLDEVDEGIAGQGVRLVRFADDFVILCKGQQRAGQALERVATLLRGHGLMLDPVKTRLVSFEQGFKFLGHLFVRSLALKQQDWEEAPCPPDGQAVPVPEPLAPPEPPAQPAPPGAAVATGSPEVPDSLAPQDSQADATTPDAALTPSAPPSASQMADRPAESVDAPSPGQEAGDSDGLSPRLRVLYVTGKGRCLDLRNRALSVRACANLEAPEILAVQPGRVDRVELWPETTITPEAQREALKAGLQVAYLDGWGRTLGTLEPPPPDKAGYHLAQAALVLDPVKRLELARLIVGGRLRNQRALLRRLNRKRREPFIDAGARALGQVLRRLTRAATVEELMGHEGEAAHHYWQALARAVDPAWGFDGRNRRPPRDPLNAVISLTSSILYRDLLHLLQRHGLHPGFGALHGSLDGHQGTASDLVEEFRAPLCEGLTVYLANNRILRPDMFDHDQEGGCLANQEGRRVIVPGLEDWLDRPVRSPHGGHRVKWRGLLEEQVLAYRRHALGEETYQPYLMDY